MIICHVMQLSFTHVETSATHNMDNSIVNYYKNKSICRRQFLFSEFDYNLLDKPKDCKFKCCDLHALIRQCEDCDFDIIPIR